MSVNLYTDADFARDVVSQRSTTGVHLTIEGPHSNFPIQGISTKQTSQGLIAPEVEIVAACHGYSKVLLLALDLWAILGPRMQPPRFHEDNQATIACVEKGYSPKLRHILRTHKVNLASLKEIFERDEAVLKYINTNLQAADIFTKALEPQKWDNALHLLGVAQAG